MAKRGRPRKNPSITVSKDPGSRAISDPGSKLTKHSGSAPAINNPDPWSTALKLSQTVSDAYAMMPSEQELAFNCALTLRHGAVLVELGVMYGSTAIILAYAAKLTHAHYYGIDNFRMGSSKEEVEATLTQLELTGTILHGETNSVKWSKPIDYLLIDAGHDEMNMRQDTKRWLPLVSPGGLVLFHAYNPDIDYTDPHFPVKRWADERTQGWTDITYLPYLLVKQKPV